MTDSAHVDAQLEALAQMTYQQWFTGRAAYLTQFRPVAADSGEQAMRADYLADKGWWYHLYDGAAHPTFADGVRAADAELPTPAAASRSLRRGWLERIDLAVTAAARYVPSQQWATTLIPRGILEDLRGSRL